MSLTHNTSPHWLANSQLQEIPEAGYAAAYNTLTAQERNQLKLCIARIHAALGQTDVLHSSSVQTMQQDVSIASYEQSCPWTLLAVAEGFLSAPRLLAALLPPILSRVPNIAVVFLHTQKISNQMLVALELAGQEDVYTLQAHNFAAFLHTVAHNEQAHKLGQGRCLFLGKHAASLREQCQQQHIPYWQEPNPVHIALHPKLDATSQAQVASLHPDAILEQTAQPSYKHAAFFVPQQAENRPPHDCPLQLDTAQQHIWLWPDLSRSFFTQRQYALFAAAASSNT